MSFPSDLMIDYYRKYSFLINTLLYDPRNTLPHPDHYPDMLAKIVDDMSSIHVKPDFFPGYYYEGFWSRRIIPKYRIKCLKLIIMDFINFIFLYGQSIIGTVYRGIDLREASLMFTQDITVIEKQSFVSTSIHPGIARGFGDNILCINTNKQVGIVIPKIFRTTSGEEYNESEILFPPCRMEKLSDNKKDGEYMYTNVAIENLPPPMSIAGEQYYMGWLDDTELWNYYKTHSYYSLNFNKAGGKKRKKEKTHVKNKLYNR